MQKELDELKLETETLDLMYVVLHVIVLLNKADLKSLKTGRINIQHDQDSDSRKKISQDQKGRPGYSLPVDRRTNQDKIS
ncbi:hypothetical protein Lal_00041695 [Lupinus albus]|nr:hypothetical protein Lal_00041695 [Lupinus albus]